MIDQQVRRSDTLNRLHMRSTARRLRAGLRSFLENGVVECLVR